MKNSFLLSLGLLSLAFASGLVSQPPLQHQAYRALSSYVTKNGNITLSQDALGFTAQVDFTYDYDDASDANNNDDARFPMAISLYSSQTFIVSECLDFFSISCSEYGCSEYTYWNNSFTLPYYSVNGYYAYLRLYLDYDYYEVQQYITLATSCSTGMGMQYGNSRYGVIGLGLSGASSNFLSSTLFTVSANRSQATAQLLFKEDTDRKAISTYVASLSSDANWQISSPYTYLMINGWQYEYNTTVIFDLDSDGIGLPWTVYYYAIDWLEDAASITCNTSSYAKPTCSYYGSLIDLPIIQLQIQGYTIDIPPTLYVGDIDPSNPNVYLDGFTLNFRAISPSLTGVSYVTPEYENYTILDMHFLNYYFAEFNGQSGYYIYLYTQYSDNYNPYVPVPIPQIIWPFIVGGCLGLIIIISIICCCCRAAKNRRAARSATSRVSDTSAPLVVNAERTDLLNPQNPMPYAQNNQYMGYPYQQQPQYPPHTYGNLPGYTYIPSQNQYPYLPPPQGPAANGNVPGYNNALYSRQDLNNN